MRRGRRYGAGFLGTLLVMLVAAPLTATSVGAGCGSGVCHNPGPPTCTSDCNPTGGNPTAWNYDCAAGWGPGFQMWVWDLHVYGGAPTVATMQPDLWNGTSKPTTTTTFVTSQLPAGWNPTDDNLPDGTPYFPDYGCRGGGSVSLPGLNVPANLTDPVGNITLSVNGSPVTGPDLLVMQQVTATPGPCQYTTIGGSEATMPVSLPSPAPTNSYVTLYNPSLTDDPNNCPRSVALYGGAPGYTFLLEEQQVLQSYSSCPSGSPAGTMFYDFSGGSGSSFCSGTSGAYGYPHVVNPPGVSITAKSDWVNVCSGFAQETATGAEVTWNDVTGTWTGGGYTIVCAPPIVQTWGPTTPRPVDQIEPIGVSPSYPAS